MIEWEVGIGYILCSVIELVVDTARGSKVREVKVEAAQRKSCDGRLLIQLPILTKY